MTTNDTPVGRFDIERAVKTSGLPPSERLVLFVLLTHADNDSVVIPAKFTPSLTGLASETGLDRRTVERMLCRLETKGWLTRKRPPVEQSRRGARTRYHLTVPVGAQDPYPDPQLGAQGPQARGVVPLAVGAPVRLPRGVVPPISTQSLDVTQVTQRASARGDDPSPGTQTHPAGKAITVTEIKEVTEAVRARTGETISLNMARRTIEAVLERAPQPPGNRLAYVLEAIANEPLGSGLFPTRQPLPVRELMNLGQLPITPPAGKP